MTIRSTQNATISCLNKRRHIGLLTTATLKSQLFTLIKTAGGNLEVTDTEDVHLSIYSTFPDNAFNGTFE